MSRYSLRPLAGHADLFEVALGWDPGLGTFFVTLFGTPDPHCEPAVHLWRGTRPREITQASDIVAIAARFAEVPEDLARQLELDRLASPHNDKTDDVSGRPAGRLLEAILGRGRHNPRT
jgi:hypothetical protein